MIKLAIFDFDNTLVNSDYVEYQIEKQLISTYGGTLSKCSYDKYHNWLFLPPEKIMEYYIQDFHISSTVEKLLQQKEVLISTSIQQYIQPMKGARELLSFLTNKNIICAVASDSTSSIVKQGLELTNLSQYISPIVSKDDVLHKKPYSDIYHHVLSLTHISAHQAIAFDDAYEGVTSAKNAGIFCFAMPLLVADYNKYEDCDVIVPNLLHAHKLLSLLI